MDGASPVSVATLQALLTPITRNGKRTRVRVIPTPNLRQSLVITSTPHKTRDGIRLETRTFMVVCWDKAQAHSRPDAVKLDMKA